VKVELFDMQEKGQKKIGESTIFPIELLCLKAKIALHEEGNEESHCGILTVEDVVGDSKIVPFSLKGNIISLSLKAEKVLLF